jgi:cell division protein FtsB
MQLATHIPVVRAVLLRGLLAIFIIAAFLWFWRGDADLKCAHVRTEIAKIEADNDVLATRAAERAARIHALRTDPRMLEKIAREELGMIRRGETVYLLPHDLGAPVRPPAKSAQADSTVASVR